MKVFYIIVFIGSILLFNTLDHVLMAQTPYNDPTWQLIMNEEFDSLGIDTTVWSSLFPWGQDTVWLGCDTNGDSVADPVPDYYYAFRRRHFENCVYDTTGDGKVTLQVKHYETQQIDTIFPFNWDTIIRPYYFSTQMLYCLYAVRFGWIECNVKAPQPTGSETVYGLQPNFWMYEGKFTEGGGNDSVAYSEIDMAEICGEHPNGTNYHTCNSHYTRYYVNGIDTVTVQYDARGDTGPDTVLNFTDYHRLGVNWKSDGIDYFIDDRILRTFDTVADSLIAMSMMLDIWAPATPFCQDSIDTINVIFPYNYDIDYVKVWQLRMDCDSSVNSCNFDPDTYVPAVYSKITLGGASCTAKVENGDTVVLRAVDYTLLEKNFEVELGGDLLIMPTKCQNCEYKRYRNPHPYRGKAEVEPPSSWYRKFTINN